MGCKYATFQAEVGLSDLSPPPSTAATGAPGRAGVAGWSSGPQRAPSVGARGHHDRRDGAPLEPLMAPLRAPPKVVYLQDPSG